MRIAYVHVPSGEAFPQKRTEMNRHITTKHAMDLVRLMRMGLEILQTGELHVRRPDAEELNAIRDGVLTYDELMETAMPLQSKMEAAAGSSRLLPDVDYGRVDRLEFGLVGEVR